MSDTTNYSSGIYGPGISSVGSYQVAGTPWMTGSANIPANQEDIINFPGVTKSITIINRAAPDLLVHFAATGSGNVIDGVHYISLTEQRDSITLNVKTNVMFISNVDGTDAGHYEVFAELTGINPAQMFTLTGSGITE
tara:strand:- start:595 stop:1008 length:414 start_codon:yes stop_codon:yes gene_type:complete